MEKEKVREIRIKQLKKSIEYGQRIIDRYEKKCNPLNPGYKILTVQIETFRTRISNWIKQLQGLEGL